MGKTLVGGRRGKRHGNKKAVPGIPLVFAETRPTPSRRRKFDTSPIGPSKLTPGRFPGCSTPRSDRQRPGRPRSGTVAPARVRRWTPTSLRARLQRRGSDPAATSGGGPCSGTVGVASDLPTSSPAPLRSRFQGRGPDDPPPLGRRAFLNFGKPSPPPPPPQPPSPARLSNAHHHGPRAKKDLKEGGGEGGPRTHLKTRPPTAGRERPGKPFPAAGVRDPGKRPGPPARGDPRAATGDTTGAVRLALGPALLNPFKIHFKLVGQTSQTAPGSQTGFPNADPLL